MAPKTPKRYSCSMCSKTERQVLGGHKSSHYKFTMKIYDAIDDLRPKKQLLISTATCHQQIGDGRTHYTCKICFKTFPSGQALGGHQRRQWTGNMKRQSAPKILDFDMNELPKEEDHEDFCTKC
ncbi:zinc finger protein ZAT10-like [Henckelia pumila]|uniref:zinc finger protein ZAT10-like n=1 Tax=Henckelia pumila TaxID=405737 RepID=UPI003C6DB7F1